MKLRFIQILLLCSVIGSTDYCQSPYKLSREVDIPITVAGVSLSAIDLYLLGKKTPVTIEDLNLISKENVNDFDRGAVNNYSNSAAAVSDVMLITSIVSPLLLFTFSSVREDAEIFTMMCVENALLYFSIPHLAKATSTRYRPYVYNPEVPIENKLNVESKLSFFSGHTTPAFANAVFLSKVYSDYFPDSGWKPYIWTANLLLASAVGYFRYSSGSHFPTDIITGAVVGMAIGFFIPLIHKNDETDITIPAPVQPKEILFFRFNL